MNAYDPTVINHWIIFTSKDRSEASLTTKSNVAANPWLSKDLDGNPMIEIAEAKCFVAEARELYEEWLKQEYRADESI